MKALGSISASILSSPSLAQFHTFGSSDFDSPLQELYLPALIGGVVDQIKIWASVFAF